MKRDLVIEKMQEVNFWDDVYVDIGEDKDGNFYFVFDGWDDLGKFSKFAKEVLGLDDDVKEYDIEDELNASFVFSDEYTSCSDCSNIIRTSPNSYGWQPNFYVGDGFIACEKCFNNTEEYQESYISDKINNPTSAVNGLMTEEQIESLGFVKVDEDFQSGWYNRHDNPKAIYDELSEKYDEVLFFIDGVGQFHVDFVAFIRGGGY